jgi:hypothetical protein
MSKLPVSDQAINVFVGTDDSQMLGARVLHFSILRHTKLPVRFETMEKLRHRMPSAVMNRPATGFSFTRFMIPSLMGFQGRAIYMDADMLVFRPLEELWHIDLGSNGKVAYVGEGHNGRKRQFSVLLLDCAKLDWKIDAIIDGLDTGRYSYVDLMGEFCIVEPEGLIPAIPAEWNSLEHYEPGKTCLLHYTEMPSQPWVSRMNRYRDVWVDELALAVKAGFIEVREIREAIRSGFARPSLMADVKKRLSALGPIWSIWEKAVARSLDRRFSPHKAATAQWLAVQELQSQRAA